jgi:hypothetical protein
MLFEYPQIYLPFPASMPENKHYQRDRDRASEGTDPFPVFPRDQWVFRDVLCARLD